MYVTPGSSSAESWKIKIRTSSCNKINQALLHYEVRIFIFDDPAELEESQRPKFCSTQVYSTSINVERQIQSGKLSTLARGMHLGPMLRWSLATMGYYSCYNPKYINLYFYISITSSILTEFLDILKNSLTNLLESCDKSRSGLKTSKG
jgi:hypothetical protein